MVEALLTAQLPTSAAMWTLGAKLWIPFLRMLSGATGQRNTRKPSPDIYFLQKGAQTFLWKLCCQWLLGRQNHRKAPSGLSQNRENAQRLLDEWKSWEKASTPHYWGVQIRRERHWARSVQEDEATKCKVLKYKLHLLATSLQITETETASLR